MAEKPSGKGHRLVLEEREKLSMTGVRRVHAFDPKEIVLETEFGMLGIKGEKMGIKQLDLEQGAVEIEGYVEAITYPKRGPGSAQEGFWGRILR